ncbi:reticulon-3-B-like isoform X2 [Antedon mediterranea]|uniref:reticulon-3-B-like isoform X2 n=1 Tax=Antedon mediterranea TaxID=105859 RepID=UPI003AF8545D
MEDFEPYKSEAEANQQQDLFSDGFVRVDNPADSTDQSEPKVSDNAEEDLYSASAASEEPAAYSSDLVSFDSSPTTDNDPLVGLGDTVSSPADSSSDPEPQQQFTEESYSPQQDEAPVDDLLGGFGSSEPDSTPPPDDDVKEDPPAVGFMPEVNHATATESNSGETLSRPSPVVLQEPEEEQEPVVAAPSVEEAPPVSSSSPTLIGSSPSEVVELVYWRDPKKSGVAFGSILIVLLAFANFSSISVIAYLLLSILTVTISFRVYKSVLQAVQKTGDGNPFKPYLEKDISISEDVVNTYAAQAVEKVNCYSTALRRYILVEDLVESIKFAVFLWFLTYIGCMFNGLTLVIFAHIGLFSLPLVYEMNKAQIDDVVGKAYTKVNAIYEQVKDKIPFLKKKND